ncbi:hypothetical protein HNY73_005879 [Argiope bruennichi]|uniref:Uncharacterized protein n=1 Tax=Argiope bruennichi TaxID=94029 RepID=A0A8T0FI55_ARGBR|nr:hypothetical protein HNY73_005879 [Argiope bruennichi]
MPCFVVGTGTTEKVDAGSAMGDRAFYFSVRWGSDWLVVAGPFRRPLCNDYQEWARGECWDRLTWTIWNIRQSLQCLLSINVFIVEYQELSTDLADEIHCHRNSKDLLSLRHQELSTGLREESYWLLDPKASQAFQGCITRNCLVFSIVIGDIP